MKTALMQRSTRCWPWFALAGAVALADQTIKGLVHAQMDFGQVIPLIPFFNWVYTGNTGAAFSFLADAGGWQHYLFIGLALLVAIILTLLLSRPIPRLEAMAFSLFLGGALGNALDRLARGYVVDYLDVYWGAWHWPAFNLADIALFLGVLAYAIAAWHARPASKEFE